SDCVDDPRDAIEGVDTRRDTGGASDVVSGDSRGGGDDIHSMDTFDEDSVEGDTSRPDTSTQDTTPPPPPGPPEVVGFGPEVAGYGERVTITGTNLGSAGRSGVTLTLGEEGARVLTPQDDVEILSWTEEQIELRVPFLLEGPVHIHTPQGSVE